MGWPSAEVAFPDRGDSTVQKKNGDGSWGPTSHPTTSARCHLWKVGYQWPNKTWTSRTAAFLWIFVLVVCWRLAKIGCFFVCGCWGWRFFWGKKTCIQWSRCFFEKKILVFLNRESCQKGNMSPLATTKQRWNPLDLMWSSRCMWEKTVRNEDSLVPTCSKSGIKRIVLRGMFCSFRGRKGGPKDVLRRSLFKVDSCTTTYQSLAVFAASGHGSW